MPQHFHPVGPLCLRAPTFGTFCSKALWVSVGWFCALHVTITTRLPSLCPDTCVLGVTCAVTRARLWSQACWVHCWCWLWRGLPASFVFVGCVALCLIMLLCALSCARSTTMRPFFHHVCCHDASPCGSQLERSALAVAQLVTDRIRLRQNTFATEHAFHNVPSVPCSQALAPVRAYAAQ